MSKTIADLPVTDLAIVDLGHSKVAMVVPASDAATRTNALAASVICKAVVVEKIAPDAQKKQQERQQERQRAEALRRARILAEKQSQRRVRKVLLLAAEADLQAISPDERAGQGLRKGSHKGWRKLNAITFDRNKRALAYYAMAREPWQAYERVASYAGVKIIGFLFPPISVGQALLAQQSEQQRREEGGKNFIVLDIGARRTSLAIFADGMTDGITDVLPCACASIDFGADKLNQALVDALQLSSERAEQLKNSLCFSESLLTSYSDELARQNERGGQKISREMLEGTVEIQRRFPKNVLAARNRLSQRNDAQGAERILAPLYATAMQEVVRLLNRLAPRLSPDAPVYMCGGGAAIAGSQTLTAHILKRCVFPALLPRITGTSIRMPLHSISALAGLFVLGNRSLQHKVSKNPNQNPNISPTLTETQQFNLHQHQA